MKLFDLLKARWQEAAMLIVLQTGLTIVMQDVMMRQSTPMPAGRGFLLGLGLMGCGVIWQMLYMGFLRTASISGELPASPVELLREGRSFFWRVLGFQLIWGLLYVLALMVLLSLVSRFLLRQESPPDGSGWIAQACSGAVIILGVKYLLFVPAFVVVWNCTVLDAFRLTAGVRLTRLSNFVPVFVPLLAAMAAAGVVSEIVPKGQMLYYPVLAAATGTSGAAMLTLAVAAAVDCRKRLDDYNLSVQAAEMEQANERQ